MKVAEIISVGSELLMGQIADTNAQELGSLLPAWGIAHYRRQTVGDNLARLTEALHLALSRSDLVFTIGGLGPTEDDLTRDGIAAAFGVPQAVDEAIAEKLRRLFVQRNIPWVEAIVRQAHVPVGAETLENSNGTAPGLWMERDGKVVIALPGPKNEFGAMLRGPVRERLARFATDGVLVSRVLKVVGMGESLIESQLGELIHCTNPTLAPYAKMGEVHLRLTAHAPAPSAAEALLDPFEAQIRGILGPAIYGGEEDSMEGVVLAMLQAQGQTLGVAESITGGELAQRLTSVPGASTHFRGGIVAYQGLVKAELLKVEALSDPVSAQTACEMAEGALRILHGDWAISTTGNAGPTSDIGGKPVGLCYVAVSGPGGTTVEEHKFRGKRADIRTRVTQAALVALRNRLLSEPLAPLRA